MFNYTQYITSALELESEDSGLTLSAELGLNEDQTAALPTLRSVAGFMNSHMFAAIMAIQATGAIQSKQNPVEEKNVSAHLMRIHVDLTQLGAAKNAEKPDAGAITKIEAALINHFEGFCRAHAKNRNTPLSRLLPQDVLLMVKFPIPADPIIRPSNEVSAPSTPGTPKLP